MSGDPAAPRVVEVAADTDDPPTHVADAAKGDDPDTSNAGRRNAASAPERAKAPQVNSTVSSTPASGAPTSSAKPSSKVLGEEALTQVAQAKFEAQEDKLTYVARHTMALIRDYGKIDTTTCSRRVTEIWKSLLRYEMQHIRVWELQERRRLLEIAALEAAAQTCKTEAKKEEENIIELRKELDRERRRRKRYERYEESAAEVNKKKKTN